MVQPTAADIAIATLNAALKGKVTFLQIGAHDGQVHDPINGYISRFKWRGVVVEPIPDYYAALCRTYAAFPQVTRVNVAIGAEIGTRPMFKVAETYVDAQLRDTGEAWIRGVASFDKAHLLKHDVPPIFCEQVEVETITGRELIRKHGPRRCDLMVVDVEGCEAEVLSTFDFSEWRPTIITFESKHISPVAHPAIEALLVPAGYRIAWSLPDSIAVASVAA